MYLTKENLKTIERYLRENGVKDSQFPPIEEATGDEYLVIDTALGNRRVKLKSIINLLEASGIEDSLNSDATNRSLSARQGKVLKEEILKLDENKQDSLKSGETIKTINNESILGKGNIEIPTIYITDFTVYELLELADNRIESINSNISLLEIALLQGRNILVPYDKDASTGYALLTGYVEDLVYFKIFLNSGEILGQVLKRSTSISNEVGEVTFHSRDSKQDTLISGENIKTINGESILGEGNISITGSENTSQIYHWEKEVNEQGVITKEEYDAISKADIIILWGISCYKEQDPEDGFIYINFHTGQGGYIIDIAITINKNLTYSAELLIYTIPSAEYIDNAIKEAITNTLTTEV